MFNLTQVRTTLVIISSGGAVEVVLELNVKRRILGFDSSCVSTTFFLNKLVKVDLRDFVTFSGAFVSVANCFLNGEVGGDIIFF